MRVMLLAVILTSVAQCALAEPYWIAWEGDDFPENEGWTRVHGDSEGSEGEAFRTLEDGVLTYDSLHDLTVYDGSTMELPGELDPEPGELFIVEWRVRLDEIYGIAPRPYDPNVAVFSDSAMAVSFRVGDGFVQSGFEFVDVAVLPLHEFAEFRMTSHDMETYTLEQNDSVIHTGNFTQVFTESRVAWGDAVQGAASLHSWDYFRFGVIPEPGTAALWLITTLALRRW